MKVYFAYAPSLGLIKIGCAMQPQKRVRHLAVECGHSASVLFMTPGSRAREVALHRRYAGQAVCNEWFRPEGDLATLLKARGYGHLLSSPINARVVGQMKRRYTLRLKRVRDDYRARFGKPFSTGTLRRHYESEAPPPDPKPKKTRKGRK